jgi:hypothetical protein
MIEGGGKETVQKSESTKAREAFFLEFAEAIRSKFPSVPLMVTGGFRTRGGMEAAVVGGACDLVGVGRPACLDPALPKNTIFNATLEESEAHVDAPRIHTPSLLKMTGVKAIGAGVETVRSYQSSEAFGSRRLLTCAVRSGTARKSKRWVSNTFESFLRFELIKAGLILLMKLFLQNAILESLTTTGLNRLIQARKLKVLRSGNRLKLMHRDLTGAEISTGDGCAAFLFPTSCVPLLLP